MNGTVLSTTLYTDCARRFPLPVAVFRITHQEPIILNSDAVPWHGVQGAEPVIAFPSFSVNESLRANKAQWLVWFGQQLASTTGSTNVSAAFDTGFIPSPIVLRDPDTDISLVISPAERVYGTICGPSRLERPRPDATEPSWGCGVSNAFSRATYPGVTSTTVMYAGSGLTQTMHDWGVMMQTMARRRERNRTSIEADGRNPLTSNLSITKLDDVVLRLLTVYTDNGAFNNAPVNGWYTQGLLLDILRRLADNHLKIGALQLDDFWYNAPPPDIDPTHMLLLDPDGNKTLFPHGLKGLSNALARLPLVIYGNHFGPRFPWLGPHSVNGSNVTTVTTSLGGTEGRLPVGPSAKHFYLALFRHWISAAAMTNYEIDFMQNFTFETPGFAAADEGGGAAEWLDGMYDAAQSTGVPIQICSATAYDVLYAMAKPAVTNVRASPDYRDFPNHFVGNGFLLAWALGLAPSKDVTWTRAAEPTRDVYPHCSKGGNHSNVELDLMIVALSAGPVGLGDAVGFTNATRARALCNRNGTLLPPSKPLTPLDFTVWPEGRSQLQHPTCAPPGGIVPRHSKLCYCQPQLLQTHTSIVLRWLTASNARSKHDIRPDPAVLVRAYQLLAVAVKPIPFPSSSLWPMVEDLVAHRQQEHKSSRTTSRNPTRFLYLQRTGLSHDCIDGRPATAKKNNSLQCVAASPPVVGTEQGFIDEASHKLAWQTTLASPLLSNGWCLLGELSKYNPWSGTRITGITVVGAADTGLAAAAAIPGLVAVPHALSVAVAGAAGELVILYAVDPDGYVKKRSAILGAAGVGRVVFNGGS